MSASLKQGIIAVLFVGMLGYTAYRGRTHTEEAVDKDDHSLDCARYLMRTLEAVKDYAARDSFL